MNCHQLTEVKAVLAQPVNKLTKYDIALILTILIVSFSLIITSFFTNTGNATGFEIHVDGEIHSVYSFSDMKNGEIIEIKTMYGYNKFIYKNNSVECIDTDCKDKIELKAGPISKVNQIIVCVPHKLTVQIVGKSNLDGISY